MQKRPFLLTFAAALLLASLQPGAEQARAQGIFGLSEDQEIEIGRQAAEEIEKKEPILADQAVTAYLDRLGQFLVRSSGRSDIGYQFKVVDSADINAFALPGGFIYINRGLIETAENESELAGVMGHEIGHVVARHSVEQIKKLQLAGLGIGILGAILGEGKAGQIGNIASQLVATGVFLKYSREAEREADQLGAKNLYDAGYDPRSMVTFFDKLAAMQKKQPSSVETFFSSHPNAQERSENVSQLIDSFPRRSRFRIDSRDFRNIKSRLATLPPPVKRIDQPDQPTPSPTPEPVAGGPGVYRGQEDDARIAARFAPVFHLGVTANSRFDFPTNFDFDGDWRADNNARNASAANYRPRAYVYYSLSETETNYFIFYGLYFPVDDQNFFDRRAVSLENDLEVSLVVVEKTPTRDQAAGEGRVAAVEIVSDGRLAKYVPNASLLGLFESISLEEGRPVLFVDPRGHRLQPFTGDQQGSTQDVREVAELRYGGRADEPTYSNRRNVSYDLSPLQSLWELARGGDSNVFGETLDLGSFTVQLPGYRGSFRNQTAEVGRVGSSFLSGNRRPGSSAPWVWSVENARPGEWYLDPAGSFRRHFGLGSDFSATYLHHPALGVIR